MTTSPKDTGLRETRRDIVIELANAYYEKYRYDRPNDTKEQLYSFCRDIAKNELDEYTKALFKAHLTKLEGKLPESKPDLRGIKFGEYRGYNTALDDVKQIIEDYKAEL